MCLCPPRTQDTEATEVAVIQDDVSRRKENARSQAVGSPRLSCTSRDGLKTAHSDSATTVIELPSTNEIDEACVVALAHLQAVSFANSEDRLSR